MAEPASLAGESVCELPTSPEDNGTHGKSFVYRMPPIGSRDARRDPVAKRESLYRAAYKGNAIGLKACLGKRKQFLRVQARPRGTVH